MVADKASAVFMFSDQQIADSLLKKERKNKSKTSYILLANLRTKNNKKNKRITRQVFIFLKPIFLETNFSLSENPN